MSAKQELTMGDIARLANVSKPTVSRALSNSPLVNEETRQHVLNIANKHGYAVNRNAQKLRHSRTNTVAVSLDFISHNENHITDPFIFDLLAGVSEALGNLNQDLLLCAPNHNNIASFQQLLTSRAVDGFIFLGQGHRENVLTELAGLSAPMVVWGAATDATPYSVVGSDNFRGGEIVADYFLSQQRYNLLFVGDTSFREIGRRRDGLTRACAARAPHARVTELKLSDFSFESSYATAQDYLKNCPSLPQGIFAYNDTTAMAFIRACQDRGIAVPKDISIVGYNDIPASSYFSPAITTVRQDTYQAGRLLVDSLMQFLDGETQPMPATIRTELIVRET